MNGKIIMEYNNLLFYPLIMKSLYTARKEYARRTGNACMMDLSGLVSAAYIRIAESTQDEPPERIAYKAAKASIQAEQYSSRKHGIAESVSNDEEQTPLLDFCASADNTEQSVIVWDCIRRACKDDHDMVIINYLIIRETVTEIANRMGLHRNTIAARITGILERLRKELAA